MHKASCTPFRGVAATVYLPLVGSVTSRTVAGGNAQSMGIRAQRGNVVWVSVLTPGTTNSNAQGGIVGTFRFRSGDVQIGINAGTTRFVMPDDELLDFLILAATSIPTGESVVSVWLEGDITDGDPER